MTTSRSKKKTEDAIQKEFIRWVKETYTHVKIFATRNEDSYKRSDEIEAGLPDIIIRWPIDGIRHILYLEIKTKKGKLSKPQIEWEKEPRMSNEHYGVGYGLQECKDITTEILTIHKAY